MKRIVRFSLKNIGIIILVLLAGLGLTRFLWLSEQYNMYYDNQHGASMDVTTIDSTKIIGIQADNLLVDHRWKRSTTSFRELLEAGVLTPEIDVRFDKDLTPWLLHGPGTDGGFLPPFVQNTSSKKMIDANEALSLEAALQIFQDYNDGEHHLIIEIKKLDVAETEPELVMTKLVEYINNAEVENAISFSSTSPDILLIAHREMPHIPLILNHGPIPIIDKPDLIKFSEQLPPELLKALQSQHSEGVKYGGIITLSPVTWLANVYDLLQMKETGQALRLIYADGMDNLGVGTMSTTYLQRFGNDNPNHPLNPVVQLQKIKQDLGDDTIIYTTDPHILARHLPHADIQ